MGGRGVSSASRKRFLSQFGSDGYSENALGFKNNDTLKQAIGVKGKSMTPTQARVGANPFYSRNHKEYSQNCQRAVVAYELRRRGYSVTAQATFSGDKLRKGAYVTKEGVRFSRWMGAFKGVKPVKVGEANRKKTVSNIEAKMRSYGKGSRGIIQVVWSGSNSGHVFSVENLNGNIIYNDAQTGKTVNINSYMKYATPSKTQIVRTDNLAISNRAKDFVSRRT